MADKLCGWCGNLVSKHTPAGLVFCSGKINRHNSSSGSSSGAGIG